MGENMSGSSILIATKNKHKAGELAALLSSLAEVMNLSDWESSTGKVLDEPDENGLTFQANALIKSRQYAQATGLITLADDSGLSVEALGGAPGVLSARYGGPGLNDDDRCELLLKSLAGHHDRRAFFTSVLSLSRPDGASLVWEGRAEGLISREKRGGNGFGYDPVFYFPPCRKTFAELGASEKNEVSHRARASRFFMDDISKVRRFVAG
ncbi:non-canonical purine NTP pyrophosphatase, RdgB/HAM1 family [Deltaproteobacteria bacterium Smac51]|nr:non-canonical purine NTP pyrophosphatase, RdgB/HAM1 family [Deltaproteobacteria bacterium Smac51]